MEAERLHRILTRQGKPFICAIMDDEKTSVMEYGKSSDLMFLLHSLYHSVKNALVKQYGEPLTEKMMRTVSMTDDELNKELKTMQEEKKNKEIPAWLKKLMDIDFDEDDISYDDEDEEDEDDSVDETDGDEETGDEEDEPTTYHFRGNGLRLDISIHPDDAVRSDD